MYPQTHVPPSSHPIHHRHPTTTHTHNARRILFLPLVTNILISWYAHGCNMYTRTHVPPPLATPYAIDTPATNHIPRGRRRSLLPYRGRGGVARRLLRRLRLRVASSAQQLVDALAFLVDFARGDGVAPIAVGGGAARAQDLPRSQRQWKHTVLAHSGRTCMGRKEGGINLY